MDPDPRHVRKSGQQKRVDGDLRDEPQRDRDRILYSSAFRRLAGVTQVVTPSAEIQLTHNRLTHTLKVAQIGRRLAERLTNAPDKREAAGAVGGIEPEVVEAAALAHDLGHPPFGHIGEMALDGILRDAEGLDGFEGNAQTFRIVTKLSLRSFDYYGLDLTKATRNAILKYPWLRDNRPRAEIERLQGDERLTAERKQRKWGAYPSERHDFDEARSIHVSGEDTQSAEATLMDWADDVSYAIHDFDDFYRAGLIDPRRLVVEDLSKFLLGASERLQKKEPERYNRDRWASAVERVQGYMESDRWKAIFRRAYSGDRRQRGLLHDFTSELLTQYIENVRIGNKEVPIIIDPDTWHEVNVLKELTRQYVINHPALATVQRGQRQVIRGLFAHIKEWIGEEGLDRLPTTLNQTIQAAYEDEEVPATNRDQIRKLHARAIGDFIAALTENQAVSLHQQLIGATQESVLGTWLR